jgi:NAD-dependent deacetylase
VPKKVSRQDQAGGNLPDGFDEAVQLLRECRYAVALTGAGMSVESGIPPFRGRGGLWERFNPEEYAHVETLRQAPERAWLLFRLIDEAVKQAQPHPGHRALARLEQEGRLGAVITQNVDGLHQRAGSRQVVEFHGSAARMHCFRCGQAVPEGEPPGPEEVPRCSCGGVLRPDVVLFGEPIPVQALEEAQQAASRCDLMLVVGTSVYVYPAAALPAIARSMGARILEVNPEPTPLSSEPDTLYLAGTANQILPPLADAVLGEKPDPGN